MAGAGSSSRRALSSALSRFSSSSAASSTSHRPASRLQQFSSRTDNWSAQTLSGASSSSCRSTARFSSQRSSRIARDAFVRGRRAFSSTAVSQHGHIDPPKPGEERKITFIDKDGDTHTFEVADGDNLLDIAQANELEMEGACGGSCACSTCHVIVESDHYDLMEEPDDEENDMLDLAFGLTETSRLGCQVKMSKELDGLVVKLPNMTRNLQASDFK